jgi:hypothetical protein
LPGVLSQPAAVLTVLPDGDGDGMADAWETDYSLDPANPDDAHVDTDGDGLTNLEEHRSGTNPQDPTSYLQVLTMDIDSGVTIQFTGASNMTYTVEYNDDLDFGFWRKLTDVVARPTNWVESVWDPNPSAKRFYRIITPRQLGDD